MEMQLDPAADPELGFAASEPGRPLVAVRQVVPDAVERARDRAWDARALRERATVFSRDRFRLRIRFLLDRLGFGRVLE